jgi:hypothetical protein
MNSTAHAEQRPHYQQLSPELDKMAPKWNALKHGLRSAAILLPDDDAQEFHQLRRDLFQTYRPRTRDEAACVEAMAAHQWRIARCRRWQAVYDAQTDALLFGDPHTPAGHICETDPHRWMHKSLDCTLQESRLDRLLCRSRDKLLLLQKLRRNNQIAGAVELEPALSPAGFLPADVVSPPESGGLGGNGKRPAPASCSVDGEIRKSAERIPHGSGDSVCPSAPAHHPACADSAVPPGTSSGAHRSGIACLAGQRPGFPAEFDEAPQISVKILRTPINSRRSTGAGLGHDQIYDNHHGRATGEMMGF